MNILTFRFLVTAQDPDRLSLAKQLLKEKASLDYIVHDTAISGDIKHTVSHRLGDFFESIETIDVDPGSFLIAFAVKPHAPGFWKDLVVLTVSRLRKSAGVTIQYQRRSR